MATWGKRPVLELDLGIAIWFRILPDSGNRQGDGRLPQTGNEGISLKQLLQNKLLEHRQYINQYGQEMPEIQNWKWQE